MYKASPQVALISPYKGLSPLLIFNTFSTVPHTHTHTYTHTHTLSLSLSLSVFFLYVSHPHIHNLLNSLFPIVSSGCNELSCLAQEAVTEVFIKPTAIHKVPRTGKSHSSMKQRREGWSEALGDWSRHGKTGNNYYGMYFAQSGRAPFSGSIVSFHARTVKGVSRQRAATRMLC